MQGSPIFVFEVHCRFETVLSITKKDLKLYNFFHHLQIILLCEN